jgi:hypothetical protein
LKINEKNWWREPRGHTQPQTTLPRTKVRMTVKAAKIKDTKIVREAIKIANARRGSKWKKISTRPI